MRRWWKRVLDNESAPSTFYFVADRDRMIYSVMERAVHDSYRRLDEIPAKLITLDKGQ